jgi:hypothetical protein
MPNVDLKPLSVVVTPAACDEFRHVLAEPGRAGKTIRLTFAGFS